MKSKGSNITLILLLLTVAGLILLFYPNREKIRSDQNSSNTTTTSRFYNIPLSTSNPLGKSDPAQEHEEFPVIYEYFNETRRPEYLQVDSLKPIEGELVTKVFKNEREISKSANYEISLPSSDVFFRFYFDNDIFCNTDYYYTNGVGFELVHPYLEVLPTARFLLPSLNDGNNFFSIGLTQHIFTPVDPDKTTIQYGDRPFAGYLYITLAKTSLNYQRKISLRSSVDLGVIGPASLGGAVQSVIHEIQPVGWQNQVQNDFVFNYNTSVSASIFSPKFFDISLMGDTRLGTLYTDFSAGIRLATGNHFPEYYSVSFIEPGENPGNRLGWQLAIKLTQRFVAFNGTLQGGMFNSGNVYTLSGMDVNHFVVNASTALRVSYNRFGIYLEQSFVAPEFSGSKHHLWGRIMLDFKL